MGLLLLGVGALVLALLGLVWMRQRERAAIVDRLTLGFKTEVVGPSVEELMAGDYGLSGTSLFGYRLIGLLNSLGGRIALGLIGGGLAWFIARSTGRAGAEAIGLGLAGGFLAIGLAYAKSKGRNRKRDAAIRRALPDALELLAAIMEGGTAFDAALGHVVRDADPRHPLYRELGITLEAMRRGRRRHEALSLFAQRVKTPQVEELVSGLIQADQSGSSIADVLRHHARKLFLEYEAEVQRRAERLPIKMMLPMFVTIMPAMLIVTGFPSFLRIYRTLESIFANAGR